MGYSGVEWRLGGCVTMSELKVELTQESSNTLPRLLRSQ